MQPIDSGDETAPWERLASTLHTQAGQETLYLLRYIEALNAPAPPLLPLRAASEGPQPIGPWKPRQGTNGLEFVADLSQSDNELLWWCSATLKQVLRPKRAGDALRVVLLGESAAAGQFYRPHATPALALQSQLQQHESEQRYEVIDLTRVSLGAAALLQLVESVGQLQADCLIILAGNNFSAGMGYHAALPATQQIELAESYRQGGAPAMVMTFQQRIERLTEQLAQRIVDAQPAKHVIFAVPPVNHGWERQEPAPWLGRGQSRRWYEAHTRACSALELGEYATALAAGNDMLEADQGCCSTTHRVLGNAHLALGQLAQAEAAFAREVDVAGAFGACASWPGVTASTRRVLAAVRERPNMHVMDLAESAAQLTPSERADLFVDYCHFSPRGMYVFMAPIAAQVDACLGGRATPAERSSKPKHNATHATNATLPGSRWRAAGLFLSGLYISHGMAPVLAETASKLVAARFRAALQEDPRICDAMLDYLRARDAALGGASLLSRASHRLLHQIGSPLDVGTSLWVHGIDAEAITLLCESLTRAGQPGSQALEHYLESYLRLFRRGVDITEPAYMQGFAAQVPLRIDNELMSRRSMPLYRSRWPLARFSFVVGAGDSARFRIVYRMPACVEKGGRARVSVGGTTCADLEYSERWRRSEFELPPARLRAGFNTLTIHWPALAEDDEPYLQGARRAMAASERPDLFPVFGELFSCHVHACAPETT